MRKPANDIPGLSVARLALSAATALLLAACATTSPHAASKQRDAAAYNVQLGLDYMNQGELARAKEKLDRALSQNPSSADVHSARALLFQRMGSTNQADAEFRTALRLAPHDPQIVNSYAAYLCQSGRTDEGVKHFLEAAHNALYSTPWFAYTNAGVCQRTAKRDDEARANFARALQLQPNYAEAVFQLATLQFQHGELAPARASIDTFMGSFPETPDLLLLGVRVARAQGDRLAAQRYARKLQLDFPGTDQVRALAELDHNPG
ncbi:MAG TPA: type IV pilus biogenesis/stability protein PilW [Steroidobacteraceae bacterium]|jgi:type IV pilus assembly protein PilF|nr:type IV pilus biogenesis/stability protein PilW [Steroidobacteraceae bacterium]